MQQPMVYFIPWFLVVIGIVLALALTGLILFLMIRFVGRWRRNLEEEAAGAPSYIRNKTEPGKSCPRCDAINALTARYCQACGKGI